MEEITTGLEIVCSSKGKYTKISASELRLQSHTNKKIKKEEEKRDREEAERKEGERKIIEKTTEIKKKKIGEEKN